MFACVPTHGSRTAIAHEPGRCVRTATRLHEWPHTDPGRVLRASRAGVWLCACVFTHRSSVAVLRERGRHVVSRSRSRVRRLVDPGPLLRPSRSAVADTGDGRTRRSWLAIAAERARCADTQTAARQGSSAAIVAEPEPCAAALVGATSGIQRRCSGHVGPVWRVCHDRTRADPGAL